MWFRKEATRSHTALQIFKAQRFAFVFVLSAKKHQDLQFYLLNAYWLVLWTIIFVDSNAIFSTYTQAVFVIYQCINHQTCSTGTLNYRVPWSNIPAVFQPLPCLTRACGLTTTKWIAMGSGRARWEKGSNSNVNATECDKTVTYGWWILKESLFVSSVFKVGCLLVIYLLAFIHALKRKRKNKMAFHSVWC